jgi:hypothetical protein
LTSQTAMKGGQDQAMHELTLGLREAPVHEAEVGRVVEGLVPVLLPEHAATNQDQLHGSGKTTPTTP